MFETVQFNAKNAPFCFFLFFIKFFGGGGGGGAPGPPYGQNMFWVGTSEYMCVCVNCLLFVKYYFPLFLDVSNKALAIVFDINISTQYQ